MYHKVSETKFEFTDILIELLPNTLLVITLLKFTNLIDFCYTFQYTIFDLISAMCAYKNMKRG